MRCIAVIEAERPGLDSVIVWEHNNTLVAFAYLDGKVAMTRPLAATDLDTAVNEVQINFQINNGQLSRVTDWQNATVTSQPINTRTRW